MTKRVEQHQLEDLSRTMFKLLIPQNWVCRDKDKDYGIDVEVEIFDDNDRATGLVFWGQLKATKSEDDSIVKNLDIKIDSIKYYKSLNIPVLIVRYSAKQDIFYYKWVDDVDLFYAKENAKTLRVAFDESNLWKKDTPGNIYDRLNQIRFIKQGGVKFPITVSVDIKDDIIHKISKGIFLSSFRTAISGFPEFTVFQNDTKKAFLLVLLNEDEMEVNLSSVSRCKFHSIRNRDDQDFVEGIAADTLIGCAINLNTIGQREMMARIVMDNRLIQRFVTKQDVFKILLPALLKTSFFGPAMDLVADVMRSKPDNEIEIITLIATRFEANPNDEEKTKKVEEFLIKCLDKYVKLNLASLIGISHYNLGSHYRHRMMLQSAIKHYLQARKFEKAYLNQPYYYQELAGALFECGKYRCSSILYQNALNMGAEDVVTPLLADAYMFSGKYQKSLSIFSEYLESKSDRHDGWYLKEMCLDYLIKRTGFTEQERRKKEALAAIDIKQINDGDLTSIESALKLDALCGLAWFNLGIAQHRGGNNKDAVFSFTICGLVQTWDKEAWINAASCCFDKVIPYVLFPLIIRTAFYYCGDSFLSLFYSKLNSFNPEFTVEAANIIEQLLPKAAAADGLPTVRMLGPDGKFKNIFRSS